jgi:hypothetical protein
MKLVSTSILPVLLFAVLSCRKKPVTGSYLFTKVITNTVVGNTEADVTSSPPANTTTVISMVSTAASGIVLTHSGQETMEFDRMIFIKKGTDVTCNTKFEYSSGYLSCEYKGEIVSNKLISGTFTELDLFLYQIYKGPVIPQYYLRTGTFTIEKQ